MKYFIADNHFYHENLLKRMDMRDFTDIEAMNEHMIAKWNEKVNRRDDVYILGDFSLGTGEQTNEILKRLHGALYLIEGNHDRYLYDKAFDLSRFSWVKNYAEIKDNKRRIILSHYPMLCYNGQYYYGQDGLPKTYMLYGHVHNTVDEEMITRCIKLISETEREVLHKETKVPIPCQLINCFCMFSGYLPLSLDEWIAVDEKRRGIK